MGVYQDSDGKFVADYRDEFDKRQRAKFHTPEAAEKYAQLRKLQVSQLKAQLKSLESQNPFSVADAVESWISGKAAKPSTQKSQTGTLAHFKREFGDLSLRCITPTLLSQYFLRRAESIAPTTLGLEKRFVKAMFAHAKEQGINSINPASSIRGTAPNTTTARAITRNEELDIITLAGPRTLCRFLLALDAGLRVKEITALRENSVDPGNRIIRVWAAKTSRTRALPMTGRLSSEIAGMLNGTPDRFLFPLARPTNFLDGFRTRAGFHFRFHDLRHTFATRLMEAGASERHVAHALGHAWRKTTDRYIHLTTDDLRPFFQKMECLAIDHAMGKLDPDLVREDA
ncbi:MAG: tyrosine-type recombinase/integrase [Candidatus Acidiferrales bacterium]